MRSAVHPRSQDDCDDREEGDHGAHVWSRVFVRSGLPRLLSPFSWLWLVFIFLASRLLPIELKPRSFGFSILIGAENSAPIKIAETKDILFTTVPLAEFAPGYQNKIP
jgi:hypothetical protein